MMFGEGDAVLYMKVGTHAQEDLAAIIARKQKEIDEAGMAMWGYGGNTCHPTTMVQPFADGHARAGHPVILAMQPMNSKHFADPIRAEEYSVDGATWQTIPEAINVLGSRYALCIDRLEAADLRLDLSTTRVGVGRSLGKAGKDYVRGRVDKACLEVTSDLPQAQDGEGVTIGLVAEVVAPYAVFLRN